MSTSQPSTSGGGGSSSEGIRRLISVHAHQARRHATAGVTAYKKCAGGKTLLSPGRLYPVGHIESGATKDTNRGLGVVIRNFADMNPLETSKKLACGYRRGRALRLVSTYLPSKPAAPPPRRKTPLPGRAVRARRELRPARLRVGLWSQDVGARSGPRRTLRQELQPTRRRGGLKQPLALHPENSRKRTYLDLCAEVRCLRS